MGNFIPYLKGNELLTEAFKFIINNNTGAYNPYHSNFHLIDVFTTSMELANLFDLSDKDRTELGLATLFHDYNHSGGKLLKDSENITLAIMGLTVFLTGKKEMMMKMGVDEFIVEELINITEYPHTREPINPKEKIILDADLLQCYNNNWFLNVIIGFYQKENKENIPMKRIIESQISFIKKTRYYTDHAKYIQSKEQDKMLEKLYFLLDIYK